jgi:hypothetical protein
MKRISLLLLVGAVMPLAACATVKAKAPADRPTLEVPMPPGKVIEPMPYQEPATPEPVGELPVAAPANPRPAKPPVREPVRTDPKPELPVVEAVSPPVTPAATSHAGHGRRRRSVTAGARDSRSREQNAGVDRLPPAEQSPRRPIRHREAVDRAIGRRAEGVQFRYRPQPGGQSRPYRQGTSNEVTAHGLAASDWRLAAGDWQL